MTENSLILEEIKSTAEKHMPGSEVILFGSRARNDAFHESDYDVLIVTDQILSPREKLPLRTSIRKELLSKGIRTDILIQGREELNRKKLLPGHIIRSILKDGVYL